MSSRRSFVNNMDRGSYGAVNNEPNPKDYCPACSVRLKYSSRLNDFFCSSCGYVRKEGKPVSFVVDDGAPNYSDNNSKRKGPLTTTSSSSDGSIITANELEVMKIKPLPGQAGMNRRQESFERDRLRNLQGYDNDMKHMERMGYSIIDSWEHIPTDNGSTYDANETKGTFSNLKSNRRMYFR